MVARGKAVCAGVGRDSLLGVTSRREHYLYSTLIRRFDLSTTFYPLLSVPVVNFVINRGFSRVFFALGRFPWARLGIKTRRASPMHA